MIGGGQFWNLAVTIGVGQRGPVSSNRFGKGSPINTAGRRRSTSAEGADAPRAREGEIEEPAHGDLVRGFYRSRVKPVLASLRELRPYSISNTVVMSGSPRGGTTWLASVLAMLPRSSLLWEPLDLRCSSELREMGLEWRTYLPPEAPHAALQSYFERVMTGRLHTERIHSQSPIGEILQTETYIVKFVRGQMMLPWLDRHFGFAKPAILLIRHPCAVVSSQLRWGEWRGMETPRFTTVLEAYPQFEEILSEVRSFEQKLAALWAMEFAIALDPQRPCPFLVVTYEQMVQDGEGQLERIFGALGRPVPDRAVAQLRRPSVTTAADSHVVQKKSPLTGWTERLSRRQGDEILGVVRRFGIDFYGEALEPDYRRLNQRLEGVPRSRERPIGDPRSGVTEP